MNANTMKSLVGRGRVGLMRLLAAIVITWLFMPLSWAQDPPHLVYRVDTRAPTGRDNIFSNGFRAWGDNASVMDHVSGRSLGGEGARTSAFIATTPQQAAMRGLMNQLGVGYYNDWYADGNDGPPDMPDLYVYTIRADHTFYGVNAALRDSANTNAEARTLLNHYQGINEWVALQQIPGTLIQRATRYVWQDDETGYVAADEQSNPLYREEATTGNPGLLPVPTYQPEEDATRPVLAPRPGFPAMLFAWCRGGASAMRLKAQPAGEPARPMKRENGSIPLDGIGCDHPEQMTVRELIGADYTSLGIQFLLD